MLGLFICIETSCSARLSSQAMLYMVWVVVVVLSWLGDWFSESGACCSMVWGNFSIVGGFVFGLISGAPSPVIVETRQLYYYDVSPSRLA